MKRRILSALLAATVAVPLVMMQEVADAANQCWLGGHLYNRNRSIAKGGVVMAECPPSWHSEPFGNWGAKSLFGGVKDTTQFAGWEWDNSQWQWNSCTRHDDYIAPHPRYYNMPRNDPRWWQETRTGSKRVNSAWLNSGRSGQTCRQRWDNRVYTFSNLQVILYELDWDGDDKVATLKYPTMRARLNCSTDWKCEGNTGWKWQRSVSPSNTRILTDSGSFEFRGLPPGSAVMVVQAQGYAPTTTAATLTGGRSQSVDVGMLLEGSVSGRVVDAQGDAIGGALVDIIYNGFTDAALLSSFVSGYVLTGDDGQFLVTGIVPNEGFSIYAELEDGSRSGSQALTASPGMTIENVVLRIE